MIRTWKREHKDLSKGNSGEGSVELVQNVMHHQTNHNRGKLHPYSLTITSRLLKKHEMAQNVAMQINIVHTIFCR